MKMSNRANNQRGGANIGLIVAIAILGAVIFAAVQLGPIFYDHWNFEDDVQTTVKFAWVNYPRNMKKALTDNVTSLLTKIGAEFDPKRSVKVVVDDKSKKIVVEVWYSRSHKLPFYPNPKQFYIRIENTPL